MDFQRLKLNNVQKILIGLGILLVIVSIASFLQHIPQAASLRSTMYDKSFIGAMNQLSKSVPENSILLASADAPTITYFTGHVTKAPWGVSSKAALVDYMKSGKYDYLVAYEGKSAVKELHSLFTSEGLKSLDDDFERIGTYCSDFYKIHLYQFKSNNFNEKNQDTDGIWQVSDVCQVDARDFGTPNISTVDSIQVRIADDGTGPVTVWLNGLSMVDENGNEILITDFQPGHGFKKYGATGTQTDDKGDFALGRQSLRLQTDGDGLPVSIRKSDITPSLDFTAKDLKLWIKISDADKLKEFRITGTSDEFKNYRNYWIKMPR